MTLFSIVLGFYLLAGLLLAGFIALYMYYVEQECPEHSEDRKKHDDMLAMTSMRVNNPKLTILVTAILCWPVVLWGNKK